MTSPLFFLCLLCLTVIGIMAWLRHVKGRIPIREAETLDLPSVPRAEGIIHRLDGMNHRNRPIQKGRLPRSLANGSLALPLDRWSTGPMTVARLAAVAHVWALAKQGETEPSAHKDRERAVARARVIPIMTLFLCILLIAGGRMNPWAAITLLITVWTLTIVVSIPSQFREWKAVAIAKQGLKDAGLYPQLQSTATLLDRCLAGLSWARVAGFAQIVPK